MFAAYGAILASVNDPFLTLILLARSITSYRPIAETAPYLFLLYFIFLSDEENPKRRIPAEIESIFKKIIYNHEQGPI